MQQEVLARLILKAVHSTCPLQIFPTVPKKVAQEVHLKRTAKFLCKLEFKVIFSLGGLMSLPCIYIDIM